MPIDRAEMLRRHSESFQPSHEINMENCEKLILGIKEVLDANGIRFWLMFGTFLGVYREGGLIPTDQDVDIAIRWNERKQIIGCEEQLSSRGIEMAVNGDILLYRDGEHADLYLFAENGDRQVYKGYGIPTEDFETPCWVEFLGYQWRILNHPKKWLHLIYGPKWRTPDPNFSAKGEAFSMADYREDE